MLEPTKSMLFYNDRIDARRLAIARKLPSPNPKNNSRLELGRM